MSDIVERLRGVAHTYDEQGVHSDIELGAADEIEKLRAKAYRVAVSCGEMMARNEKLRAAIKVALECIEDVDVIGAKQTLTKALGEKE